MLRSTNNDWLSAVVDISCFLVTSNIILKDLFNGTIFRNELALIVGNL
jgi:hypothetical protein